MTLYFRAVDDLGVAWERIAAAPWLRAAPPADPVAVHRRWRQRLESEMAVAAVLGPVGTVLAPAAVLTTLVAWTADLGRSYGWDVRRSDHARVLRDLLGESLTRHWRRYARRRPSWPAVGVRGLRALVLGQDMGWVTVVMETVDRKLQAMTRSPDNRWDAEPIPVARARSTL
jgi:hypothetical protein